MSFREFDVFKETGIVPPIQNWHVDGTMVSDCKNPCLSTKVVQDNILTCLLTINTVLSSDSGHEDHRGAFLPEHDQV